MVAFFFQFSFIKLKKKKKVKNHFFHFSALSKIIAFYKVKLFSLPYMSRQQLKRDNNTDAN